MEKAVASKLLILLTVLLFISKSYALSDKNDDQYLMDIDQTQGDLNIDAGIKLGIGENSDEADSVNNLKPILDIGYAFQENHKIEIGMSYNMVYYGTWSYVDNDIADATGTINLSYNYRKNVNNFQLLFGSHFSIPLFKSDEHLEKSLYTLGTREYTAGVSFALTRRIIYNTLLNIIWNAGMEYDIGLPHEDDSSWDPGTIRVTGNLALNFNKFLTVSSGIQQILSFSQGSDIICYTVFHAGMLLSHGNNYFLFSSSIPVTWFQEQFASKPLYQGSIIYGHKFNFRK